MITENLSTLKINKLTQEQYNRELEAGNIDENALYLTPDEAIDLSLYATKEELDEKLENKSDAVHNHNDIYYTESEIDSKFDIHNVSTSSHNDIRDLINGLTTRLNALADSDDTTLDQMSEIVTYIKSNKSLIDSITTAKVNVSDIVDNLTTNVTNKTLSAAQGVAIKGLIDSLEAELETGLNGKANKATTLSGYGITNAYTKTEIDSTVSTLNTAISAKANSTHIHAISDVTNLQSSLDTKANASDLHSHVNNKSNPHSVTLEQLGLTATATELNYMEGVTSNIQTQLNKKADDYSIELYNGTSGNPKPVKFMTVNYSTCGSENGVAIKVGMVSGHGNGSSYAFLEDAIIKVTHTGVVSVDNFKYYGADTGTYDGANRQYGDIFWVIDTTNKIVDFYCLMGQYARIQMTPYKRVTYSTGGTITQYTSCTVYSSGEKNWGNNSEFAMMKDIPAYAYGTEDLTAGTSSLETGKLYFVYE